MGSRQLMQPSVDPLRMRESASSVDPKRSAGQHASAIHILHLDDDPADTSLIRALINAASPELPAIIQAVFTREAYLAALKSSKVDIILADYYMPGYDGDAALKDAQTICPDAPFIMVAGEIGEEHAVESLKAGATDYVLKDGLARLVPAIERSLRDAALRKEHREKEELIARQSAELGRANRQLEAILEGITEGLTIADMQGNVLSMNAQGSLIHDYVGEAGYPIHLSRFSDTFEVSGSDGRKLPVEEWPLSRIIRGERVEGIKLGLRNIKTGREVTLSYNGSLILDESGHPAFAVLTYRDISAATHAQEALAKSEKKYRDLFESMSEGFLLVEILTDEQGNATTYRYLEANAALEELMHLKRSEIIGKTAHEVLPSLEQYWVEAFARVACTGKADHIEHYSQDLDAWFDVHIYSPERGKAALIYTNVTERKRVDAALKESEEHFHMLADNIPQLAWIADETGRRVWYNKQWYDYTGTTPEDVEGLGWQKSHHPDHIERIMATFKEAVAATVPWEDTYPLRDRHGNYRWFLSRAFPLRDEAGRVTRWFGTNTDITEQVRFADTLRESEERFRIMADSCPLMIWVHNADGELQWVNKAYEAFFGVAEREVSGLSGWHPLLYPEDAERYVNKFKKALAERMPFDAEARVRFHSGEWRWIHSYGAPRFGGHGKFLGFVGSSFDVTERTLLEEVLKENEKNLEMMVEQSRQPMLIVNDSGKIECVSREGEYLLGYGEGELDGRSVLDLAVPVSRLELSMRLADLRRNAPESATAALRVRLKGGSEAWMTVEANLANTGKQREKFVLKFQRLTLPPPTVEGKGRTR